MEKIVVEPLDRPFARAVATRTAEQTRVFISGAVAPDPAPDAADGPITDELQSQTQATLEAIEAQVAEFGGDREHIVRVRGYLNVTLTDEHYAAVNDARETFFQDETVYPASTVVEIESLTSEQFLIEFDADAVVPEDEWNVSVRQGD